jgi:N12 class adenine-specific DNA methylase
VQVLVPGKDDFTPARRNEFIARIATGDWDAVIIAQSQFTLLPVNPETEAAFIQRELTGYREALSEMADQARAGGGRSFANRTSALGGVVRLMTAAGVEDVPGGRWVAG